LRCCLGQAIAVNLSARLNALWGNARLWLVLGALLARGVGFIASFVVGRFAGASALGMYSTVVNTSAAVSLAGVGAIANATTVHAGEDGGAFTVRRLLLAYLGWTGMGLVIMLPVLYGALRLSGLFEVGAGQALAPAWLFATAAAVMLGTLMTTVVTGLLTGAGAHLANARVQSAAAVCLMGLAAPVVLWGGLSGALAFAAVTACLPAGLSMALAWRIGARRFVGHVQGRPAWRLAGSHLRASAPSAVALMSTAGVAWLSTIYMTQRAHGVEGVAAVAVANQWLTIMLMPATSWGGVLIRELMAHHRSGSPAVDWGVVRRLARHNLIVTGGIAILVALAAGSIASAYGLMGLFVREMIWINALAAVVATVLAVPERVLVCQGRQRLWLCVSWLGLLVQWGVVWRFVDHGVWVAPLAALLMQIVMLACVLGCLRATASKGA
jgi:hypothetical protein